MSLGQYIGAGPGITKGLYYMQNNADDSSGNSNHGTATGITWTTGGAVAKGAYMDNTSTYPVSGDYINLGATTFTFGGTAPFSIRMFIWGENSGGQLVSNFDRPIGGGWSFDKYTGANPANKTVNFRRDAAPWAQAQKAYTLSYKRIHTVGVYDPVGQTVQVFVNGDGTDDTGLGLTAKVSSGSQTNYTAANCYIGTQVDNLGNPTSPYRAYGYTGTVDEVVIEARTWTVKQVARDYAQSIGRLAPHII